MEKSNVKQRKSSGKCVFCGSSGLTKEHIFPNWMRHYIRNKKTRTKHAVSNFISKSIKNVNKGKLTRPGDPHSQRLRIVCQSCNNGWMSRLQNSAKEILIPHLKGRWENKSLEEKRILSTWATMFTMVLEHADLPTLATPTSQREHIMMHGLPPPGWHVCIGCYNGSRWEGVFNHFGLESPFDIFLIRRGTELPDLGPNTFQAQSTAFMVGNLFFLTHSSVAERIIDTHTFERQHDMITIWPERHSSQIGVPAIHTDTTADLVSRALVPSSYRMYVRKAWQTWDD